MGLDSNHEWVLKPLGERLMGDFTNGGTGRQSPNILMNLSITKNGTTRHYVPYDVMQQKTHSLTYDILSPRKLNLNLIKPLDLAIVCRRHGTLQEHKLKDTRK